MSSFEISALLMDGSRMMLLASVACYSIGVSDGDDDDDESSIRGSSCVRVYYTSIVACPSFVSKSFFLRESDKMELLVRTI